MPTQALYNVFRCRTFVLLLTIMSLFAGPLSTAKMGGQDASGGNPYEGEFRLIGLNLIREIKEAKLTDNEMGVRLADLENAVNKVRPIGTSVPLEQMKIGKLDRMGINSGVSKVIVFSNEAWRVLDLTNKRLFVLHEYLRFTFTPQGSPVDDVSLSQFSVRIIRLLGQTKSSVSGDAPILCRMWHFSTQLSAFIVPPTLYAEAGFDEATTRKALRNKCYQAKGIDDITCGESYSRIDCVDAATQDTGRWLCVIPAAWGKAYQGSGNTSFAAQVRLFQNCQERGAYRRCNYSFHATAGKSLYCRKLLPDETALN